MLRIIIGLASGLWGNILLSGWLVSITGIIIQRIKDDILIGPKHLGCVSGKIEALFSIVILPTWSEMETGWSQIYKIYLLPNMGINRQGCLKPD